MDGHVTVLLKEAIESLQVQKGLTYIDCTFGGGGHSKAIVDVGGIVLAMDTDSDAMDRLPIEYQNSITLIHRNFEHIEDVVLSRGIKNVAGVLFDLGLSSFHLSDNKRGFSFMSEGPLDMRFDATSVGHTAGELIDLLPEKSLADLFVKFGEEPHAKKIAHVIKMYAQKHSENSECWSTRTTKDLAELIEKSVGRREKIHPATRVFQALRMAVNDELGVLERSLNGSIEILDKKGRIVVISFHSLEDRVVKNVFQNWQKTGLGVIIGDLVVPKELEVIKNNRSRSAKMRVFEKNC